MVGLSMHPTRHQLPWTSILMALQSLPSSAVQRCCQCRQAGPFSGPCCCSHGLKEEHARFFFQQIILAIDYCHKMKVSNRWVLPPKSGL